MSTKKGQELKTNLKVKNSRLPLPQRQILVELKLHNKLEFQNSGRSLYILDTMVDCNIFGK